MCAALGGRAAEEIVFGKISTGALSDLEKVTKQATAMVSIYGLNKEIGNISYYDSQDGYGFNKPYSESTAQKIDEEVKKIIEEQYVRAKEILSKHKDKLALLAEQLLEKEVIFQEDLERIFGKRPFGQKAEEVEVVEVVEESTENTTSENTTSPTEDNVETDNTSENPNEEDNK